MSKLFNVTAFDDGTYAVGVPGAVAEPVKTSEELIAKIKELTAPAAPVSDGNVDTASQEEAADTIRDAQSEGQAQGNEDAAEGSTSENAAPEPAPAADALSS